jgi:Haem-binding domain
MRKKSLLGAIVLLVVGVLIQFVPVEHSNPPVESDIPTSPEVKVILKRACYDCHSHEVVWLWYSRVAPVAWLIARDVREGREAVNFSTWNRYSSKEQSKKLRESWEEVDEGEMPPWYYTLPHPEARLSTQDRNVLRAWTLGSSEKGVE